MAVMAVLGDMAAAATRWRVWVLMANQDLAMRYRRSVLGPFWISLSMAVMVLAMAVLYSQILNFDFRLYLAHLAAGFLAWWWLTGMLNDGCNAVIENDGAMRNVTMPIPVAAARSVYRNFIIFAHNALVVVPMLALCGVKFTPEILFVLPALIVYALAGFFATIVLGPMSARFRDVPQVVGSILQMMFFLSPVIWVPSETSVRPYLIEGNPFFHFLELIREPLLGRAPSELNWIFTLSCVGILAVLAVITLGAARRRVFLWL